MMTLGAHTDGFQTGMTIGSCRVIRRLGNGGMSTVYEVEHVRLGVRLALKSFTLEGHDAEFLKKRFYAEGKVLARIHHPRIMRVVDMDVEPTSGKPYFVMDLVRSPDGAPRTLAEEAKAGIAEDRLLALYGDLREALKVVHDAGIVHRDLKPENVLIDCEGRAVLTDFGVCRIVDDSLRRQLEVTRTMVVRDSDLQPVLGTAAYLSPEVRAGAEPTATDDYYALGVMLFRLLTGVWYAPGTNVMSLLAPFNPQWKRIFAALLAVDPAMRNAPEVQPPRRHRQWWPYLTAAILLIGAGAAWYWFCRASSSSPGEEAEEPEEAIFIPASAV